MKKFTTKLLMSIIAVAFAFVALGTSTYAWFSMNESVSVTGMEIAAKSDSMFLIIGKEDNVTTLQNANEITADVAVEGEDLEVYPSAHRKADDGITLTGSAVVTNTETAIAPANWYKRVADAPSASASTKAAAALQTFDEYVIRKTVYVTLAKGSNAAYNLKLSSLTISGKAAGKDLSGVTVLITTSDAAIEFSGAQSAVSSNTVLASTVTANATVAIDFFIYYDGNATAVYTNNIANLTGATITASFTVSATND